MLLEAEQRVLIENSTLSHTSCNESAPLQEHTLVIERRTTEVHTQNEKFINFETPTIFSGGVAKNQF